MFALLIPILATVFGEKGFLGAYLKSKADMQQANNDFKLATMKAQSEQEIQNRISETTNLSTRLNSTSQGFKQSTYIFVCAVITFSIIFPSHAVDMWKNFSLIPHWFSDLFKIMTLTIWGLPIAAPVVTGMFTGISNAISDRREYKLKRFNTKLMYDGLRKIFPAGMTQEQVNIVNEAVRAAGIDPETGSDA